uniref:Uncharacterized protein n=1 Tax=Arundo donax TaxID=35708 RepID=A0A0A9F532_ARUDO
MEKSQNGEARKIERKAGNLRRAVRGGGKDRADLSIRFAIFGEKRSLGCARGRREREEELEEQ